MKSILHVIFICIYFEVICSLPTNENDPLSNINAKQWLQKTINDADNTCSSHKQCKENECCVFETVFLGTCQQLGGEHELCSRRNRYSRERKKHCGCSSGLTCVPGYKKFICVNLKKEATEPPEMSENNNL